jgi:hypothetical protein
MEPGEQAKAHHPSNAMNARTLDARSLRKSREVSGLLRSGVCRHRSTIGHWSSTAVRGSQNLPWRKDKEKWHGGSVPGARRQVADECSLRVGSGGGIRATRAIKRSWHVAGLNTSRLSLMKPNLAFKRTPNGRPRNGIMFILAVAQPAVWRRLTLR